MKKYLYIPILFLAICCGKNEVDNNVDYPKAYTSQISIDGDFGISVEEQPLTKSGENTCDILLIQITSQTWELISLPEHSAPINNEIDKYWCRNNFGIFDKEHFDNISVVLFEGVQYGVTAIFMKDFPMSLDDVKQYTSGKLNEFTYSDKNPLSNTNSTFYERYSSHLYKYRGTTSILNNDSSISLSFKPQFYGLQIKVTGVTQGILTVSLPPTANDYGNTLIYEITEESYESEAKWYQFTLGNETVDKQMKLSWIDSEYRTHDLGTHSIHLKRGKLNVVSLKVNYGEPQNSMFQWTFENSDGQVEHYYYSSDSN